MYYYIIPFLMSSMVTDVLYIEVQTILLISLVINLSLFCLNITSIKSWTYLFRFKHVLAEAFWFKLFYLIAKHSLNEQYVFLWNQHVKYCKLLSEIISLYVYSSNLFNNIDFCIYILEEKC